MGSCRTMLCQKQVYWLRFRKAFRDFLKETVPWLLSMDIKVFRETKVKLADSLEEGIFS